jgi:hypothetical protein
MPIMNAMCCRVMIGLVAGRSIQQQAEPTNEKEADSFGLRTLKRKQNPVF